ncbi:nitrate reductase cytochrome c-type subunit [Photobacterium sp. MCCC 1A19761]|uniref:nitrate reductase cytochrome c-type subunit n=1 Tax=Photobacterium sp. MCCC 1A19761 TaxID=3115000 RepID=UPI00307EADB6
MKRLFSILRRSTAVDRTILTALALVFVCPGATAVTDRDLATLRQFDLNTEPEPPRMSQPLNTDVIPGRNYPMQPPLIPHKIDNYQVDLKVNKCMACHARSRVEETQARMISVTHYMDRDGNFLAELSPRRYFCQQCHVVQTDAKPLVASQFTDLDTLIDQEE